MPTTVIAQGSPKMNPSLRCRVAQLAAALVTACAAEAHSQPIREFDLQTVERLGRAIYEHDLTAWRATDALLHDNKAGRVSDAEMAKIRGYIVAGTPDESVVKFIAEGPEGPYPVSVLRIYRDEQRARAAGPLAKQPLTEAERAQYRARQLALSQITQRWHCSERYNTVILPNTDGDGYLVYVLAATTKPGLMMVGGHYRITVSADGNRVIQTDELSRSCLTVELKPPQGAQKLESVVVLHLVSDAPVETHVFLNLLHRMDIGVTTEKRALWLVSKGRIRRLADVK